MHIPDLIISDESSAEQNSVVHPEIVVSASSPSPSPEVYRSQRRDITISVDGPDDGNEELRQRGIQYFRTSSKDSTFSTMDEEDEELARLRRDSDQV